MPPPELFDEKLKGLVTIDREPTGQSPRIDETALKHRLTAASEGRTPAELSADESRARATLQRRLLSTHRCGPPAAWVLTTVIGLVGKLCAIEVPMAQIARVVAKALLRNSRMKFYPFNN